MNDKTRKRVKNSMKVIGNDQPRNTGPKGVKEGTHFKVLAYTDYADMFIPTVITWQIGDKEITDNFSDIEESKELRNRAINS